jgi:DNA-binding XRE family transcriptional regulator
MARIQRKTERTPEEKARLAAIREKFQRERPSLETLVATGEYEAGLPGPTFWAVMGLAKRLREEREKAGLSLEAVAEKAGIDKGALSRLETGKNGNPTLDTLARVAKAIGMRIGFTLVPAGPPHDPGQDAKLKTPAARQRRVPAGP